MAYLVLYEPRPTTEAVRNHLRQRLPDYMLPSAIICLDALPLTPHGKLDRQALPAPETHADGRHDHVPPRNSVEQMLFDLCCLVLGTQQVGVLDNFFELGGDSIKAALLINRLQEKLGEYVYVDCAVRSPPSPPWPSTW